MPRARLRCVRSGHDSGASRPVRMHAPASPNSSRLRVSARGRSVDQHAQRRHARMQMDHAQQLPTASSRRAYGRFLFDDPPDDVGQPPTRRRRSARGRGSRPLCLDRDVEIIAFTLNVSSPASVTLRQLRAEFGELVESDFARAPRSIYEPFAVELCRRPWPDLGRCGIDIQRRAHRERGQERSYRRQRGGRDSLDIGKFGHAH